MRRTARFTQWTPGALYGAPLRWATPRLSGRSAAHHIALTFDDGPDPRTTPHILRTLEMHGTQSTFFVIGEHIAARRNLLREMHDAGHELAVHGWTHRCVLRNSPQRLASDLRRTTDLIADITGAPPRWYRPPYGVTTLSSNAAAQGAGLTPVLWTAWGRDWSARREPQRIARTVLRTLRPGGTVLLHDTDRYAPPDMKQRTASALAVLLDQWRRDDIPVGRLAEHWP